MIDRRGGDGMDGWKKVGNVLQGAITALFGILMLCILFATVALDRNIDNPFANTVRFDNAAYYLAALAMLCGLFCLFCSATIASAISGSTALTSSNEYIKNP